MLEENKMATKRRKLGLSLERMARVCDVSPFLLEMLESNGWKTLPGIAARIIHKYGLGVEEYNAIVLEKHRAEKLPDPEPQPTMVDWIEFRRKMGFMRKKKKKESADK